MPFAFSDHGKRFFSRFAPRERVIFWSHSRGSDYFSFFRKPKMTSRTNLCLFANLLLFRGFLRLGTIAQEYDELRSLLDWIYLKYETLSSNQCEFSSFLLEFWTLCLFKAQAPVWTYKRQLLANHALRQVFLDQFQANFKNHFDQFQILYRNTSWSLLSCKISKN